MNDETFMNSKHAFLCEDQKLCLYSTKFCLAKHEVELGMAIIQLSSVQLSGFIDQTL